jgi:hypothetical protein
MNVDTVSHVSEAHAVSIVRVKVSCLGEHSSIDFGQTDTAMMGWGAQSEIIGTVTRKILSHICSKQELWSNRSNRC